MSEQVLSRPSRYRHPFPVLVCENDLKTSRDASAAAFTRATWDYGYVYQLALYTQTREHLGLEVPEVLVIAAEKERPFGVAVYTFEDNALKAGWCQTERPLRHSYVRCEATGHWPGPDAQPLTLPSWARKQL